jgi:hypothetical protein
MGIKLNVFIINFFRFIINFDYGLLIETILFIHYFLYIPGPVGPVGPGIPFNPSEPDAPRIPCGP